MQVCPNCGRTYSDKYIKIHRNKDGCDYLFENKQNIIEEYKTSTIKFLSDKYNVRYDLMSDSLKNWGVTVRGSGSSRSNKRGKWVSFNINFFNDSNDSVDKFWLLGLLAADGNVSGNHVSISQSGNNGKAIIEYVKKILESDYDILESVSNFNGKENKVYSIRFSSKHVTEMLSKYNIVKNKTYTYSFPECIPHSHINDFLCGYLEGDGCIGCYSVGGTKNFCVVQLVGTEMFIKRCVDFIPITCKPEKLKTSCIWTIWFSGKKAIAFCDWLYSSDTIYKNSKKYKNYIKCKNAYLETRRYKCSLDKQKLLDYINENGCVNVKNYCIENPQHSETVYYDWLKKFASDGLIEESQYKGQNELIQKREAYRDKLKNMLLDSIRSGTFECVRKFVNDNNIQEDYSKCYDILKALSRDGIIKESDYKKRR